MKKTYYEGWTESRSSNQTAQNHQRESDTDIEEQCQLLAHYFGYPAVESQAQSLCHMMPHSICGLHNIHSGAEEKKEWKTAN